MKILITGGLGFIGSALVKYISEKKEDSEVHILNHLQSETSKNNYKILKDQFGDRIYIIDLNNYQQICDILKEQQFDCIIHLAAKAGVRESSIDPILYCNSNVVGSLHLLEATRLYSPHTKCIFASSSTVHGDPIRSFYGLTKHMVEEMCEFYSRTYDMKCASLRFFSVYGTDCRKDLLIGKIMDCIQEKRVLQVFGDGNIRRDFTYLDDTLEAIFITMNRSWKGYLALDIGTGSNHSVNDVIHTVNQIVPKMLEVQYIEGFKEDMPISKANTKITLEEIQFKTQYSLLQGLKKCFVGI
jgi:UDP-glucuronate 4-epimerase